MISLKISCFLLWCFSSCPVQTQTRLQQQNEQLRRELEGAHTKSTQQLQSRLAELEASNRDLTEKRYKSESTIRDFKAKLVGLEEVRGGSKGPSVSGGNFTKTATFVNS